MKTLILLFVLAAAPNLLFSQPEVDPTSMKRSDFEQLAAGNDTALAVVKLFYAKRQNLDNAIISAVALVGVALLYNKIDDSNFGEFSTLSPTSSRLLIVGGLLHVPIFIWAFVRRDAYNLYYLYDVLKAFNTARTLPWPISNKIHRYLSASPK